ncbi:MAG: hypothetical protein ACRDD1_19770, partial [Planctomycetia bacterium]
MPFLHPSSRRRRTPTANLKPLSLATLLTAGLLAAAFPATAQPPVPPAPPEPEEPPSVFLNVSSDARNRLRGVEAFLRQNEWGEAVAVLQQLIETNADRDRVTPVGSKAPTTYVNVRVYCHAMVAALPPEALKLYRDQVDGQAEDLWKRYEAGGDAALLERIADEFFCSSRGDDACDALGDRAFVVGRLAEASSWWKRLAPTDDDAPLDDVGKPAAKEAADADKPMAPSAGWTEIRLRHPDPSIDVARTAAKRLIADIMQGD